MGIASSFKKFSAQYCLWQSSATEFCLLMSVNWTLLLWGGQKVKIPKTVGEWWTPAVFFFKIHWLSGWTLHFWIPRLQQIIHSAHRWFQPGPWCSTVPRARGKAASHSSCISNPCKGRNELPSSLWKSRVSCLEEGCDWAIPRLFNEFHLHSIHRQQLTHLCVERTTSLILRQFL